MSHTLIIPVALAISVFVVCLLVVQSFGKKDSVRDRVRRMTGADSNGMGQDGLPEYTPLRVTQDLSAGGQLCSGILTLLGIDTETYRKESQLKFYRSGMISPDAPIYYLFFQRIGVVFFVVFAVWYALQPAQGVTKLLHYSVAGLLLVLGIFGPHLLLQNNRQKREKVLVRSFPDALDLLLVCVESGLALDGALARTCKELGRAHPVITQELNRTRLELTLLNDRAQALTNLAERTDMIAFRSLVSALLQSERFGTSLMDTLRVLSEDYRNTRLMMAEEKAARLPVIITIPLISLMLPALFLIILGPAVLKVMSAVANQQ